MDRKRGFRALPPIDRPTLTIESYVRETEADLVAAMLEIPTVPPWCASTWLVATP